MRALRRMALLVALASSSAYADAPSVSAQLSADQVALDETVQLTVSVARDGTQAFQSYLRPDLKDWDILHQAQAEATNWTMTAGRQSVRTVEQHIYLLRPKKRGMLAVPSAMAKIDGREYRSRDLAVRVGPPSRKPGGVAPPPVPQGDPEAMRGDEDVFVDARLDKAQVYVGEQLTASWSLYTRTDILRYRATAEPKHEEFWSEDVFTPPGALSWSRQLVKGQDFQVALLLKKALFPLKAGKLTITPLEAEATTLQTAWYAGASAVKGSKALLVEVLPLPREGRPDGFVAANVGRFELSATVDRAEVTAGDALTLKVAVTGEGNVRNLKLPPLTRLDGFKVYEPTVQETVDRGDVIRGTKTWTYLLLPQKGGELTIPAVEMPFFDPGEKRYAIARAPSIPIKVIGDPQKVGAGSGEVSKENVLAARVRPLRNVHRVRTRLGERIVRGRILWAALAAPPSLLALIMLAGAVRSRMGRETVGSRRRRARAAARRRMREAELHLKGQRPSAFFGACARALYEHLELQLGTKCEALTLDELRRLLVKRGFAEETAEAIVRELESCDFARFAPSASGPGEMRAALRRVKSLLTAIERARVSGEVAA